MLAREMNQLQRDAKQLQRHINHPQRIVNKNKQSIHNTLNNCKHPKTDIKQLQRDFKQQRKVEFMEFIVHLQRCTINVHIRTTKRCKTTTEMESINKRHKAVPHNYREMQNNFKGEKLSVKETINTPYNCLIMFNQSQKHKKNEAQIVTKINKSCLLIDG